MPKADIIFLTHHHGDHLEAEALMHLRTEKTKVVLTDLCAEKVQGGIVMKNGDVIQVDSIGVEAVPAYNLVHKRDSGDFFHPKGEGNGYVLTFCDTRLYIAGDTENTPEMKALKGIDYAFLPVNLLYTMTPEMMADAAMGFRPKVLYPLPPRRDRYLKDHRSAEGRKGYRGPSSQHEIKRLRNACSH